MHGHDLFLNGDPLASCAYGQLAVELLPAAAGGTSRSSAQA